MTWLIVLISLTYCFTVGLVAKYKERLLELREENIKNEENFKLEIADLLQENSILRQRLYKLEGDYYE